MGFLIEQEIVNNYYKEMLKKKIVIDQESVPMFDV